MPLQAYGHYRRMVLACIRVGFENNTSPVQVIEFCRDIGDLTEPAGLGAAVRPAGSGFALRREDQ